MRVGFSGSVGHAETSGWRHSEGQMMLADLQCVVTDICRGLKSAMIVDWNSLGPIAFVMQHHVSCRTDSMRHGHLLTSVRSQHGGDGSRLTAQAPDIFGVVRITEAVKHTPYDFTVQLPHVTVGIRPFHLDTSQSRRQSKLRA
jgi:hypothetical protein